jgi:hypothetical protein
MEERIMSKRFKHSEIIQDDGQTICYGIEDTKTNQIYNLIDVYDVSEKELIKLLNELHEENIELHIQNDFLKDENQHMRDLVNENKQLKKQLESEHTMLDNAILLERTRMGQNSLKQYKEAIQ